MLIIAEIKGINSPCQPFGAFGGKLAHLSATDLAGHASKAAVAQIPKDVKIDSVIYGNVLQTSRGIFKPFSR